MSASVYTLRASSASRWAGQCPGSVALSAGYLEDDGPEAREGTAGHWVAMEPFEGRPVPTLGTEAPNGVAVTQDMLDGGALYQAAVWSRISPEAIRVETTLPAPSIHPANGGTIDTWGLMPTALHVVDYKFGHGFVEVFENWQLVNYVAAIVDSLWPDGLTFEQEQSFTVDMTIVQPRNYHPDGPIRTWRVKLVDLRGMFNMLRGQATIAMDDDPPTYVGAECEHCPGRHACVTLQRAALNACDVAGKAVPFDLSAMQVGGELRRLQYARDLLDARATGLEEQAFSMLDRGESVPHFAIGYGSGRETWTVPDEFAALAAMAWPDKEVCKPKELKTPQQVRALGIDAAVITAYSTRPHGKKKLVPQDLTTTRKIFGANAS